MHRIPVYGQFRSCRVRAVQSNPVKYVGDNSSRKRFSDLSGRPLPVKVDQTSVGIAGMRRAGTYPRGLLIGLTNIALESRTQQKHPYVRIIDSPTGFDQGIICFARDEFYAARYQHPIEVHATADYWLLVRRCHLERSVFPILPPVGRIFFRALFRIHVPILNVGNIPSPS